MLLLLPFGLPFDILLLAIVVGLKLVYPPLPLAFLIALMF